MSSPQIVRVGGALFAQPDSRCSRDILEETAVMAVLGVTGSGKTTFINTASGSAFPVGNGLQSCHAAVRCTRPFSAGGRQIVLIDTPGFDDTTRGDPAILAAVSTFFAELYRCGQRLAGIIYFHRITDVRMGRVALRNIELLGGLCGDDFLKNVAIVTTRWDEVEPNVGEARERELRENNTFFKPLLEKGAHMFRHDKLQSSAQGVLLHLLEGVPQPLLIQTELVNDCKDLADTSAGAVLICESQMLAKEYGRMLTRLRHELKGSIEAQDRTLRMEIEAEISSLEEDIMCVRSYAQSISRESAEHKAHFELQIERVRRAVDEEVRELRRHIDLLRSQLERGHSSDGVREELCEMEDMERITRNRRIVAFLLTAVKLTLTFLPLCIPDLAV
ncbi:hypothetical protein PQX77_013686 [Marasmius sp. AFHP31]|nr:hypothetical protein PQX77_013686 [Marasmius sp. AFHP31]